MTSLPLPSSLPIQQEWRTHIHDYASVVVLATADIDAPLWTNKQHIASRLAEEVPVLYVESLGLRAPRLSARDGRRILRRLRQAPSPPVAARALPVALHVVAPLVVPLHGRRAVRALNRRLLARQLAAEIAKLPERRLLWTYSPLTLDLLDTSGFDAIAYHCVDDLATAPRMPAEAIRRGEEQLARRADAIFASAPALAERLGRVNSATRYMPNASDWEHFSRALSRDLPPLPGLAAVPSPRAVFAGALTDYKLDWPLLQEVTAMLPDWSFVFVGPVGEEVRMSGWRALVGRSNCHFLGAVPYQELPRVLAGADVGLLPYSLTEHTRSVFPLKTTEYLAAGLPVVATPLESLLAEPGLPVAFAASPVDFAAAIASADRSDGAGRRRSEFARGRTWDTLLDAMLTTLTEATV